MKIYLINNVSKDIYLVLYSLRPQISGRLALIFVHKRVYFSLSNAL
jgi:hypothetical protein